MSATEVNYPETTAFQGGGRLIIGIMAGVLTFWLFAQSVVNIVPAIQQDVAIPLGSLNLAISLTGLFSGCFIVVAGGFADRFGRVKMTQLGFVLSIIGCLCLIVAQNSWLFAVGRIIQGLSAACIMPATLALIKTYYQDAARQRALSYWSIGSWGGSGLCSLAGGAIATYCGWKWVFILSIFCALAGMLLIRGTPESKVAAPVTHRFDYFGLFKQRAYSGATLSNFLLNAVAGTLIVASIYVQQGRGFSAFQSGMLTVGYLIAVLAMIRVGEKLLQKVGARKPMLWGTAITGTGVALMALTQLSDSAYVAAVFIGYVLFGLGLGFYATPSTDTAISNAPEDKIGVASGIYKMASSLGGAFGIAISASVYAALLPLGAATAASAGLLVNVAFCVVSFITILLMVPRQK